MDKKTNLIGKLINIVINILIIAIIIMFFYSIDLSAKMPNAKVFINIVLAVLECMFLIGIRADKGIVRKIFILFNDFCIATFIGVNSLFSSSGITDVINFITSNIIPCSVGMCIIVIVALIILAMHLPDDSTPSTEESNIHNTSNHKYTDPKDDTIYTKQINDEKTTFHNINVANQNQASMFNKNAFIWTIIGTMILTLLFVFALYISQKWLDTSINLDTIKHTAFLASLMLLILLMLGVMAKGIYQTFIERRDNSGVSVKEEFKSGANFMIKPLFLFLSIVISLILAGNERFDPIAFITQGKDNIYLQMIILVIFVYMLTFVLYTLFIKSFESRKDYLIRAGNILERIVSWIFGVFETIVTYIEFIPEYFTAIGVLLLNNEEQEDEEIIDDIPVDTDDQNNSED